MNRSLSGREWKRRSLATVGTAVAKALDELNEVKSGPFCMIRK